MRPIPTLGRLFRVDDDVHGARRIVEGKIEHIVSKAGAHCLPL